MMKLAETHWGEVDVAGFSELMWVIPLSKPTDRLRAEVSRRVLQHSPNLEGRHPEWLRDRIEALLEKSEPLVVADIQSDDTDDAALDRWSEQIVPKAVEAILDELEASSATQPAPGVRPHIRAKAVRARRRRK